MDNFENKKTEIGIRVPPGDRWRCTLVSRDDSKIWNSLTELYNHVFELTGKTVFQLDARAGKCFIVEQVEVRLEKITPEVPRAFQLYGEV